MYNGTLDIQSYWRTNNSGTTAGNIIVDLRSTKSVKNIILYRNYVSSCSPAFTYTISLSTNNSTWTDVATGSVAALATTVTLKDDINVTLANAQDARYVKFVFSGFTSNFAANEIQVWGNDLHPANTVDYNVGYTNSTGTSLIRNLAAGDTKVNIIGYNGYSAPKTVAVTYGLYQQKTAGALYDLVVLKVEPQISVPAGNSFLVNNNAATLFTIPSDGTNYYIRTFVWDSYTNATPYGAAVSLLP